MRPINPFEIQLILCVLTSSFMVGVRCGLQVTFRFMLKRFDEFKCSMQSLYIVHLTEFKSHVLELGAVVFESSHGKFNESSFINTILIARYWLFRLSGLCFVCMWWPCV